MLFWKCLQQSSTTVFPYTTPFRSREAAGPQDPARAGVDRARAAAGPPGQIGRAHSELQSPYDIVCRLLLEKKKIETNYIPSRNSKACGYFRSIHPNRFNDLASIFN